MMKKLTAMLLVVVLLVAATNVGVVNAQDVDDLFKQCDELIDQGKYEDAIFYCDKALKIDPNHLYALNNKAFALFNLGRYEEAISYYDKVLKMNPNHLDALAFKGLALFLLGKYDEAISYYDRVLEINPSDVFALKSKGLALFFLGRYKEAISYYDEALKINPSDVDASFLKDAALATKIRITDRQGRVFRFGDPNTARYDDKSPSIEEVISLPGSLKIFAKVLDNTGVKDTNIIVGKTALPMKRYQSSPNWWVGIIPSSDLPDPGSTISFKIVARDYNNNIGKYSGWAEVPCAAFGDRSCHIASIEG